MNAIGFICRTLLLVSLILCCAPDAYSKDYQKATGEVSASTKTGWEAGLPAGSETDPFAIHKAFGVTDIPNRDAVESLKDNYGIGEYSFAGLNPKTANVKIFIVKIIKSPYPPPDMAGTGPFFLIKAGKGYHALTANNFAKLFSPLENKSEVVRYLEAYELISGNKFAEVITAENASTFRQKPPKVTEVSKCKDGFRVKLVTYTNYHIEAFSEKTVLVQLDGVVREEKPEKILKMIGGGRIY